MKEDISKSARQERGIDIWRNAKGLGILNYTMRFGKSRIAQLVAERFFTYNILGTAIVAVPNDITCQNMKLWFKDMLDKTNISTVNTLYSQLRNSSNAVPIIETDLFIVDEIHKFLTPSGLYVLSNIKAHFKLGLTGVKLNKEDELTLKKLGFPIVDTITEQEALDNGWISNFREYNLAVELEDHDKEKYARFSQPIAETLELFKGLAKMINNREGLHLFEDDFNLIMAAFVGKSVIGKYNQKTFLKPDLIRAIIAGNMGWHKDLDISIPFNAKRDAIWNPNNIYERCKMFKSFVAKRNLILVHNRVKINAVLEIIKSNPVPTICFNESTEMVEDITSLLPGTAIAYHSNIETRHLVDERGELILDGKGNPKKFGKIALKKLAIQGMKDGMFKYLITAKALDEGLDIPNISQVITTAGSTNPTQYSQRNARGKTVDIYNPNKVTTIINIYVDDFVMPDGIEIKSRDKQKLMLRQSQSENEIIWITTVKDISSTTD